MKTRLRQVLVVGAFALLAACIDSTPTAPFRGALTPAEVAGVWKITFLIDSVRTCNAIACFQEHVMRPAVTGSLVVSDTSDPSHPEFLVAELRVDFEPALGRQMSCLENPETSLVQVVDSGTAVFWFTPHAADCGIEGFAEFDGKEFHGTWGEPTITSTLLSSGRFTVQRN